MIELFKADPGHIFDFGSKSPAAIFNEAILPRVNEFDQFVLQPMDTSAGLDEAAERRNKQLEIDLAREAFSAKQDEDFFASLNRTPQAPGQDYGKYAIEPMGDYGGEAEPQGASAPDMQAPAKSLTDFVKHFEGYNPQAYWDYKQWSVGYGTKGKKGERISKEDAERRMAQELGRHRSRVLNMSKKAGYNFSDNEIDALTSFDYNTGRLEQLTGNGKRSKEEIAKRMLEYRKAGGKVLKGLERRRKAEYKLFTEGY